MTLVYNVLKVMMQINSKLFDELSNSYKSEKQRYMHVLICVHLLYIAHKPLISKQNDCKIVMSTLHSLSSYLLYIMFMYVTSHLLT